MSKPILIKDWSIVTPRESSTIGYTLIFNFISSTQVEIKIPETMGEYSIVGTVNNIPISTGRIRVIRRYKKPGRILDPEDRLIVKTEEEKRYYLQIKDCDSFTYCRLWQLVSKRAASRLRCIY